MQAIVNETAPRSLPKGGLFEPINPDVTVEQVTQAIQGFGRHYLAEMLAAARAIDNFTGSTSPAEEFILTLLRDYGTSGGCLTLEDVEAELGEFRENWAALLDDTRRTALRYPHLFSTVESGEVKGPADASVAAAEAESTESAAAKEDEPKPHTKTAENALSVLKACIRELESKGHLMLAVQKERPDIAVHYLGDGLQLYDILQHWDDGTFDEEFPGETALIASIRGNLGL
jgi:hypothetical protein